MTGSPRFRVTLCRRIVGLGTFAPLGAANEANAGVDH